MLTYTRLVKQTYIYYHGKKSKKVASNIVVVYNKCVSFSPTGHCIERILKIVLYSCMHWRFNLNVKLDEGILDNIT